MEMAVRPAHDGLDIAMEPGQGDAAGHLNATPDKGFNTQQGDRELVDRRPRRHAGKYDSVTWPGEYCWHVRGRIWSGTGIPADWRAGRSGPGPGARGLAAARKGPAVGRTGPRRGRRRQPSQRRTGSEPG